jgi:hypothetical protein
MLGILQKQFCKFQAIHHQRAYKRTYKNKEYTICCIDNKKIIKKFGFQHVTTLTFSLSHKHTHTHCTCTHTHTHTACARAHLFQKKYLNNWTELALPQIKNNKISSPFLQCNYKCYPNNIMQCAEQKMKSRSWRKIALNIISKNVN